MIGGLLSTRIARTAARYAATALAILLFLLALRRSGERAVRMAEQLAAQERITHAQRQMLDATNQRPRSRDDLLERLRRGGF